MGSLTYQRYDSNNWIWTAGHTVTDPIIESESGQNISGYVDGHTDPTYSAGMVGVGIQLWTTFAGGGVRFRQRVLQPDLEFFDGSPRDEYGDFLIQMSWSALAQRGPAISGPPIYPGDPGISFWLENGDTGDVLEGGARAFGVFPPPGTVRNSWSDFQPSGGHCGFDAEYQFGTLADPNFLNTGLDTWQFDGPMVNGELHPVDAVFSIPAPDDPANWQDGFIMYHQAAVQIWLYRYVQDPIYAGWEANPGCDSIESIGPAVPANPPRAITAPSSYFNYGQPSSTTTTWMYPHPTDPGYAEQTPAVGKMWSKHPVPFRTFDISGSFPQTINCPLPSPEDDSFVPYAFVVEFPNIPDNTAPVVGLDFENPVERSFGITAQDESGVFLVTDDGLIVPSLIHFSGFTVTQQIFDVYHQSYDSWLAGLSPAEQSALQAEYGADWGYKGWYDVQNIWLPGVVVGEKSFNKEALINFRTKDGVLVGEPNEVDLVAIATSGANNHFRWIFDPSVATEADSLQLIVMFEPKLASIDLVNIEFGFCDEELKILRWFPRDDDLGSNLNNRSRSVNSWAGGAHPTSFQRTQKDGRTGGHGYF